MTSHSHPLPELLEGAEARTADTSTAEALTARLDEVAEYGRSLWEQLRRVADELHTQAGTHSAQWSADDWDRWEGLYGTTLAALAGPRGDSGYGAEQAAVTRHGAGG